MDTSAVEEVVVVVVVEPGVDILIILMSRICCCLIWSLLSGIRYFLTFQLKANVGCGKTQYATSVKANANRA